MITRRSILALFGLAPLAAVLPATPAEDVVIEIVDTPILPGGRARKWTTALREDGSTMFTGGSGEAPAVVTNGEWTKSWLGSNQYPAEDDIVNERITAAQEWLDREEAADQLHYYSRPRPEQISANSPKALKETVIAGIEAEEQDAKMRADPWMELNHFKAEYNVDVDIDAHVYSPGTYFPNDIGGLGDPHREENLRRLEAKGIDVTLARLWLSREPQAA